MDILQLNSYFAKGYRLRYYKEMHMSPVLISAVSAAGIVIILIIWMIILEMRMRRLLRGKNAHSLEDTILSISQELKELSKFTHEMEQYLTTVETRLKKSIQSVQTIRFNPFKGTGSGGNNSFSTAFLSEKGDGVLLTSMYARDRISMFAKPIKDFKSDYELSQEEIESIETCKKNLNTQ
jgi:hypothetical protein